MVAAMNFICYCWQRPRIYAGLELELLSVGTVSQIYNLKFIVYSIAQEIFFSQDYCSIMLQKLIDIPSAPVAANPYKRQF
jgi:hypothetical protein